MTRSRRRAAPHDRPSVRPHSQRYRRRHCHAHPASGPDGARTADPLQPYGPLIDSRLRLITGNVWSRFEPWEQRQDGIRRKTTCSPARQPYRGHPGRRVVGWVNRRRRLVAQAGRSGDSRTGTPWPACPSALARSNPLPLVVLHECQIAVLQSGVGRYRVRVRTGAGDHPVPDGYSRTRPKRVVDRGHAWSECAGSPRPLWTGLADGQALHRSVAADSPVPVKSPVGHRLGLSVCAGCSVTGSPGARGRRGKSGRHHPIQGIEAVPCASDRFACYVY